MNTRSVIVVSLFAGCVGYFARMAQDVRGQIASANASPNAGTTSRSHEKIYELEEVQARRRELDGQIITVVGGACILPGDRPFLIPDDDESTLLKDAPSVGRYGLSLPEWRFRDMGGIFPRCAVTGRFGMLDDSVGFDSLSPIESVSWRSGLPARKGKE